MQIVPHTYLPVFFFDFLWSPTDVSAVGYLFVIVDTHHFFLAGLSPLSCLWFAGVLLYLIAIPYEGFVLPAFVVAANRYFLAV